MQTRGGGLLGDLLMTPLGRTLPFAQRDHGAVGQPEDLHLGLTDPGEESR
jgi:hypothetical protein